MGKNIKLILGSGLLASELIRQSGWSSLSRKKDGIDFRYVDSYYSMILDINPSCIINCIACTDTYSTNKNLHWDVNYRGVNDLISMCNALKVKLVHISTDYIYANSINNASEDDVPATMPNWYSYTKLLADGLVQLLCNDYLLLRTTFKPRPYRYDVAWPDLIGNFDYVDVISKDIIYLIENDAFGIYNIGTEIKTMLELAIETNPMVKSTLYGPITRPYNTTMSVDKLKLFKENNDSFR